MRDFTSGERFETDINRLCALADTGVIRAAQRNIHQCKNGINKTLRSRRVSLNTRLMTSTVGWQGQNSAEVCLVKKVLLTHTRRLC
jgi:hypothetical protein